MEPSLGIMDLTHSLTFENGKSHYSEIEGLAARFTVPLPDKCLHLLASRSAQPGQLLTASSPARERAWAW